MKSGKKGVVWSKGKWRVQISVLGRRVTVGSFSDLGDAIRAREEAEVEHNYYTGDFSKRELTQENLKLMLHYEPNTGLFTWAINYGGHIGRGNRAGNSNKDVRIGGKTYIRIKLYSQSYAAHRLAFLYMLGGMPGETVDHINGDGEDNRWCNLREVSIAENNRNTRLRCDNKSGYPGVFPREDGRFQVNTGGVYIGLYETIEEAITAKQAAEKMSNYHTNHGQDRAL